MREKDSADEPPVRDRPRLAFARNVRDALAHLYDLPYLQNHPLARLLERGEKAHESGRVLQRVLTEAIESLKPDRSVPSESHAWRGYRILTLRFVEGLQVETVAERLSISRAQCLRDQRVAVEAVVSLLWARWGQAGGSAAPAPLLAEEETPRRTSPNATASGASSPRAETPSSNLPVQLTSFVGREREMAEVERLLGTTRLLTLTGTGGCGKTRLAYQIGADVLGAHPVAYPDGVWVVELAPLADPGLVPQTVASTFGIRDQPGQPILSTLASYLRSRRLLLLLDNCEHLVDACASHAEALLKACPGLSILATSRESLGIVGETSYRVPSLALPDLQRLPPLRALAEYESVRLFVERGQAVQPGFLLTEANSLAVTQVCWRLDGIPLAIELAAARLRGLGVEQIASRLDDRFRLLTSGSRTALRRQQTLRAVIDWSYDLLSEPEKVLFRRLAAFAGGWTLEAAEEVCAGPSESPRVSVEEVDVLDLLMRLIDRSLVLAEDVAGQVRYRLLETLRQYGEEKLEDSGELADVRRKHRDHYLALAERTLPELQGVSWNAWADIVERELDNLRAALAWCQAEPDGQAFELRLALPLGGVWFSRGYLKEGQERLQVVLVHTKGVLPGVRADVLHWAGLTEVNRGNQGRAREHFEESLALSREIGDQRQIALALENLAGLEMDLGHFGEARALLEEALPIARETGDLGEVGAILVELGEVLLEQGLVEQGGVVAERAYEEAATLAQSRGDETAYASALRGLGRVALNKQDYPRAQAVLEEALRIVEARPAHMGAVLFRAAYGDLARAVGSLDEARTVYEKALRGVQADGQAIGIAMALGRLAGLSALEGRNRQAIRLFGVLAAWHASVGMPRPWKPHPDQERDLAAARAALGEEAFARAWAEGQAMTLDQAVDYALEDEG